MATVVRRGRLARNMEFKKPHRHNRVQPGRNTSRPIDTNFTTPRIHPTRSAPPIITNPQQTVVTPATARPPENKHSQERSSEHLSLREVVASYVSQFRFTKKTIVISSVAAAVIITGIVVISVNQHNATKDAANKASSEVVQDLEYQTVLPEGKSISDLGGWRRVSPSKSDPVYAFTDSIDGKSINVSEQPLPDSFIGDTDDQVTELAKKFNATTKIQAGDIKVHLGSSSKGPQSVIFTKNSLLVLIKSQEKIEDATWIKYIKSLN